MRPSFINAAAEALEALRDIINAADAGNPYSPEELARNFGCVVEALDDEFDGDPEED